MNLGVAAAILRRGIRRGVSRYTAWLPIYGQPLSLVASGPVARNGSGRANSSRKSRVKVQASFAISTECLCITMLGI
jgi:hypothetical protein